LTVTINLGVGQQKLPVASVLMLVTYVPITGMGLVEAFYR